MKAAAIGLTTILVLASGAFGPAKADSDAPLLVPGYEAARDLAGARELPDPKTDYKVVFADGQDAAPPLSRGDHRVTLGLCPGHRFFAQHVVFVIQGEEGADGFP